MKHKKVYCVKDIVETKLLRIGKYLISIKICEIKDTIIKK